MTTNQKRNLTFKPLCHFDAKNIFFGYASIEECVQWMNWDIHKEIVDTINYIDSCIQKKYRIYSVYENQDFIGAVDLRFLENNTLEVGYVVAKSKWNQGYATDMLKSFIQDLFKNHTVEKIIAHCAVANLQSKKVLEKNGFQVKMLKKDYYVLNNQGRRLTDAYMLELRTT